MLKEESGGGKEGVGVVCEPSGNKINQRTNKK